MEKRYSRWTGPFFPPLLPKMTSMRPVFNVSSLTLLTKRRWCIRFVQIFKQTYCVISIGAEPTCTWLTQSKNVGFNNAFWSLFLVQPSFDKEENAAPRRANCCWRSWAFILVLNSWRKNASHWKVVMPLINDEGVFRHAERWSRHAWSCCWYGSPWSSKYVGQRAW